MAVTEACVIRTITALLVLVVGGSAAAAQSTYYAERGHWTVYSGAANCRALNRPPDDFNFAPYNALQLVAPPDFTLGLEVFFWPGTFTVDKEYRITLNFRALETIVVNAKATSDYAVASERDVKLWKLFERADTVGVTVEGQTTPLSFALDKWALTNLQGCSAKLPKP